MKRQKVYTETYLHGHAAASTALGTLKGIIEGVTCDRQLNDLERMTVLNWVDEYSFLKNNPALASVFDYLAEALADDVLSLEEAADIHWMIEKNLISYYDETTQTMQALLGLLSGISADDVINEVEFKSLWDWLNANEELKGLFPFDEIYSIVCQIGTKRKITEDERKFLVNAFKFTNQEAALKKSPFFPWEIDPNILFDGKEFCLTGISQRARRSEIERKISDHGGIISSRVTRRLDYLVVCAEPNRAWTHACYGRKIEEAVRMRKSGGSLAIVSEVDLWDAFN